MPEFNSENEWKSLGKVVTSLIKEYDHFIRFNISEIYKDWIGKIYFSSFLQGENENPWPYSCLLDTMCSDRSSKYWISLQVKNRKVSQRVLLKYLPQKVKGFFFFSFFPRGHSSLNGAQNFKVNMKSVLDVFTLTFSSPLQRVLKHYLFQLSSWIAFFVRLTLRPFKQKMRLILPAQITICWSPWECMG